MPMRPLPRTILEVSTPNAPQFADNCIGHRVLLRQDGDESSGQAELRNGDRDVGLAASEGRDKLRCLQYPLNARRRQPQHDFAES